MQDSVTDSFGAAMDELAAAGNSPASLCEPFLEMFPVSGASVSTLGDFLGSETLAASDARAARLDELQFDLGEGPCWDAMRSAMPVLEPDVGGHAGGPWPAFSAAIREHGVSSIFAFPLVVGPLRFGAIDLYSIAPRTLDATQSRQASAMAGVVGRHVLRRAIAAVGRNSGGAGGAFSRRMIHQATGIVLAQLDLTPDDALLVIQGHAFASDRSMMAIAQSIIDGELNFSREPSGIESSA
jgi:hypothetical protein